MRTSSIRLRANARLAILHEDYLEICDGNMLAAMLLSILIYWTDVKIAKKEENLWVWKSHQDFQEDLMFDKPGMKPPHRTTIKTAIDLILKKKFIEWRRNPKMPLDQTRQYLVDAKAVQKAIDALPPIVVKPTLQSQNTDNAVSENQQSLSENRHSNVEIPTSNTNDYSSEITDPEITGEGVGSPEPTAPDNITHLEEKRQKRETNPRMKAVKIGENHAETDHSPGSPVLPGEPRGDALPGHSSETGRQDDAASRTGHAQEAESELDTSLPSLGTPAPAQRSESLSPNAAVQGANQEKRKSKQDKPAIEPEVMAVIERWSQAMKKTYPMTDTLIKAATLLAPCQPSAEDLKKVRAFCFKSNPKWFRDERKGAVTLMDVAKNWEAWQSSLETSAPADSEQDSTLGQYYYFTEAM